MTSTALSEPAINKIKALHQEHIQNHYRKITSFWCKSIIKSIIIDVIFSSLILFFTTALIIGIILTFIANNYDPALTFYLIYLPLPLLVITIILYMLIKAGAISISLFLNQLDYNEYYRIAIADLWKDEVILDEISNNFKIIPELNFTSFSKNPKKNNLL
ncbi:hypothetical protein [Spiroplasma sp. ChiS]|uniref:hypothetical protein n=1 Tax=Spiroplasma sp. ChiS TaxID=2099885 RepID=UPI001F43B9F4|nr:hypothetical protein [Spiroplasma sp. ChiS]